MRCGWDCQISGYDDESQPLPPFRAQWQEFTAEIKQGRTPEYNGKRTSIKAEVMTLTGRLAQQECLFFWC